MIMTEKKEKFYAVFTKSTDPFTQAWTKRQWGIVGTFGKSGFQVALQVAAAMERRINHPPHAIKIVESNSKNETGKEVLNWSRI
tara:strand:+ start:55 stop:306 length:252 start_codon:yes stop_codon:yes gene_type:complete